MPEAWRQPLTNGRNWTPWNWCKNWQNGRHQAKPSQAKSWACSEVLLLWKFPRNLGFPTKTEPKLREFQSQAIKAASNQALGSLHFGPAHCTRHPSSATLDPFVHLPQLLSSQLWFYYPARCWASGAELSTYCEAPLVDSLECSNWSAPLWCWIAYWSLAHSCSQDKAQRWLIY